MKSFKTKAGTEIPISNIKGKDYLVVAQRLVWFREEKPDWIIETIVVHTDDNSSLVKAYIKDPTGKSLATAHKTETRQGFPDHLEKAETGAVGRALALLGYGTQFAPEFDEGTRLADSPIEIERKVFPDQPCFDDGHSVSQEGRISFGVGAGKKPSELNYKELLDKFWKLDKALEEKTDKRIFSNPETETRAKETHSLILSYINKLEKETNELQKRQQ